MTLRACREFGCGQLVPPGVRDGRCADHRRAKDKARGTRAQRGYGAEHQAARDAAVAELAAGGTVLCWRCGEPILTADDLHIGHDDNDRSVTRGPEHGRACNLSAAGRAAHVGQQ